MDNNENGKLESQLNLALDVSDREREKTDLGTGYDYETNVWTLIIRYSGDTEKIRSLSESFDELIGGYGIVRIKQPLIDALAALENVIYIEKPKALYYEILEGISASCIYGIQGIPLNLTGEGVLVAVIDSGIDYLHNAFLNAEGKTRLVGIWDQTLTPDADRGFNPPEGYSTGVFFSEEKINEAIEASSDGRQSAYKIVPSRDISGHGTHVAGICCGNFASNKVENVGIATKSKILAVKLGIPEEKGFPKTTELMEAVNFTVNKGIELNMPLVINISFGNTYGSHDGTSLLETYIDTAASIGRTTVVVGSGNEGAAGGHFSGRLGNTMVPNEIEIIVGQYERSFNIQLWKSYSDTFALEIVEPSGDSTGILNEPPGTNRYRLGNAEVLIYFGEPSPYSIYQEIYIDIIPDGDYLDAGLWSVRLTGVNIIDGEYDLWLPSEGGLSGNTRFLRSSPDITLTIPSTASKVITVGGYNAFYDSYADFSGRGYTRMTNQIKPDIVAPAVNISSAAAGGGMTEKSGTSMAAPFVSGGAALMMEWGIVRGNDIYLYGEKVKAYMIKGARQLPGESVPSPKTGWGALCVKNSLPL